MSTVIKSPSNLAAAVSPLSPSQQSRKDHWRGDLPPPPSNLIFSPPNQDRYSNSVNIINRHGNLLSLIDAVYPPTICHVCDTELASPSETDEHYQSKHYHQHSKKSKAKQRYLCLSPHCDQTFRSRGLLRFHISTCHLVDNEQVPRTDPLYLLYAPPSLIPFSSDRGMQISTSLSSSNSTTTTTNTTTATLNGGIPLMVPQKRKYERRQKMWNPVGKSSLPGQTNFTLSSSLNMDQPQPKRRGRPPKIKSVMPLSNMIDNNNNGSTSEHIKSNQSSPSMITFASDDSGKRNETSKAPTIDASSTSASSTKPHHHQQPKVFRLVQQVIPQRATPSMVSSSATTTFSSTLRPKNISRSNLSQTSQRLLAEKYNPLECPACQMTFQRKKNVATHLATAHAGEECFQCIYPDCYHPKRFSTREGLVYHLLHSHDTINGELNTKHLGSDTSASDLALMDSSDTASMDDDSIQTTTTTMIQPLKKLDISNVDSKGGDGDNNDFMQVGKKARSTSTTKKSNGTATTTATTPTKASPQRRRKKRS